MGLQLAGRDHGSGLKQTFWLKEGNQHHALYLASVPTKTFPQYTEQVSAWLHPDEKAYYDGLGSSIRKTSYLHGRIAAKMALGREESPPCPSKISIMPGVMGDPVVQEGLLSNQQISIAHTRSLACALTFPPICQMGIDLEDLEPDRSKAMERQASAQECLMIRSLEPTIPYPWHVLWTAKEALAKTLRTGLRCPMNLFEVHSLKADPAGMVLGTYRHLTPFAFCSWVMAEQVVTMTYPRQCHLCWSTEAPISES